MLLMLLAVTIYCLYLNIKKHDAKKQGAKKDDDMTDENMKTRKESVAEKKERAVAVEDDLPAKGISSSDLEDDESTDMSSIADGILTTTNH